MPKRVSQSVLDPWLTRPLKKLYPRLGIPVRFPPEGIVLIGHVLAITAACGLAFSAEYWWAGLVAALGVMGNHLADVLDGTHARATAQCRNGGELLDHLVDPLSFSYWAIGLCVSCGRLDLALAAVVCIYATAVLTSIKAKLIGEFALASFGPTEFKSLLAGYGLTLAVLTGVFPAATARAVTLVFVSVMLAAGVVQLIVSLVRAVRDVNAHGAPPDTTEWEITRGSGPPATGATC